MAERHPVRQRPDLTLEQQVELYREQLARLWDQVWWMTLPAAHRRRYEAEGHVAPIETFYEEEAG